MANPVPSRSIKKALSLMPWESWQSRWLPNPPRGDAEGANIPSMSQVRPRSWAPSFAIGEIRYAVFKLEARGPPSGQFHGLLEVGIWIFGGECDLRTTRADASP